MMPDNKTLAQEISQDEAYQRSGHPILSVSPFVKALFSEMYTHQLQKSMPKVEFKGIRHDA